MTKKSEKGGTNDKSARRLDELNHLQHLLNDTLQVDENFANNNIAYPDSQLDEGIEYC